MPKTYLDENGNPVKTYLDENGNPVKAQATSTIKAAPAVGSMAWAKEKFYNAADATTQALPGLAATAGAMGGFAIGGPVAAVGGAGIGGMAGAAGKQLIRRGLGFEDAPQTSADAAKDITREGAIQATIQGGTAGLERVAAPVLKTLAAKQYARALAATTAENKVLSQEIAPELAQRGVYGNLEGIQQKATAKIKELRPTLEAAYANVPRGPIHAQSPVSTVLRDLDGMKSRYVVDGEVVNPAAWNAIEGVQQTVEKHANTISPQSLRRMKQIFDESVSEAGGYTTSDLTTNYALKAQREASNTMRRILHNPNPDVAMLDREMSFWLDVQQVTRATTVRQVGQQGGLNRIFAPLATGLAGTMGLVGGGANAGLEAAGGTALVAAAAQIVRSPAWRTTSAVVKTKLADALARGSLSEVAALGARFGVAVAEASGQSNPPPSQTSTRQVAQ